jgi:hypothetical protein
MDRLDAASRRNSTLLSITIDCRLMSEAPHSCFGKNGQPVRAFSMKNLRITVQTASFWCNNAGQLRQLAREPVVNGPAGERLLELAGEYECLADKLVEDWAHARS